MTYLLSKNLRIIGKAEQMIMMDVKQGKFYACNQIGGIVIDSLLAGETLEAITQRVDQQFKEFPTTIKTDILSFIDLLIQKNLCHVSE